MRNLHTSIAVGSLADGSSLYESSTPRVNNSQVLTALSQTKPKVLSTHGFSQVNRRSVMCQNAKDATMFINEQQRVIKRLIQEFQIFIGYREQLPNGQEKSINQHSWSVYLMHAQSLQAAMKTVYLGKSLFGDGVQPPIRFHMENNGVVEAVDLPDPCLMSMVSIRAFLSGISDHKLPSVQLGNACIAELLNALVDIQQGREKLHLISQNLRNKNKNFPLNPSARNRHALESSKPVSWGDRIKDSIHSVIRFALPAH